MDFNTNDLTPPPWPALASHCPPELLVGFVALAPNAAPSIGTAPVTLDFPPKPVAQPAPMLTDDQMRAAFEAWLNPGQHAGNVSAWVEPGRYEKDTHQLAWLAWRAATKRAAAAQPQHPALSALAIVRQYPDFDAGGPLAEMMNEVLAGKPARLLASVEALAEGRKPAAPAAT